MACLRECLQVVPVEETLFVSTVMVEVVDDLTAATAIEADALGAHTERGHGKHLLPHARPSGCPVQARAEVAIGVEAPCVHVGSAVLAHRPRVVTGRPQPKT